MSKLTESIQSEIKHIQKRIDRYNVQFAENPMQAIEGFLENYVACQHVLRKLKSLLEHVSYCQGDIDAELDILNTALRLTTKELIDWLPDRSGSLTSSTLHEYRKIGDRDFYDLLVDFAKEARQ